MATDESAAATLDATRSRLKAAVEPSTVSQPVPAVDRSLSTQVSLVDSVTEGVEQWWHKSAIGTAIDVIGPSIEPHLRPLIRRGYQPLLLGSLAAGAFISLYPGRSARTVLKVAGPALLSSLIFEIAKASIRQMRGKPPPPISSSD